MRFSVFSAALLVAAGSASALPQQGSSPDAGAPVAAAGDPAAVAGSGDASGGSTPVDSSTSTVTAPGTAPSVDANTLPYEATHHPYTGCAFSKHGNFNHFQVSAGLWPKQPDGCGKGILDNLRGQTSATAIIDWTCDDSSDVTDITFKLSTNFRDAATNVGTALQLASPGNMPTDCEFLS